MVSLEAPDDLWRDQIKFGVLFMNSCIFDILVHLHSKVKDKRDGRDNNFVVKLSVRIFSWFYLTLLAFY